MKKQYYYLISSLPELRLDDYKEPYRVDEFVNELEENLSSKDFAHVQQLLHLYDNPNIVDVALENKNTWSRHKGNWSFDELKTRFPFTVDDGQYLWGFMRAFNVLKADKEKLTRRQVERILEEQFYERVLHHENNFMRKYFEFDAQLRNILIALNKRKFELEHSDFLKVREESIIGQLKSSSSTEFNLSHEIEYISLLSENFSKFDSVNIEKFLDQLRWDMIDTINVFSYFEVDMLLGYLVKLMLVERWIALDDSSGSEAFANITQIKAEELYK